MQCPKCQTPINEGSAFCDSCGTNLNAPTDPMLGRTLLNQYVVKRKLGEGGFGAVYEAEQPSMGRKVAIKTLHKHLTHDPKMVVRFRREGLAASKLQHPSSVKMFNLGETEDGVLWIAMEFLEGETLDARIRKRGPLSEQEMIELFGPVCEALSEAHQKGIIHRDLKPENIMLVPFLDKIVPKVLDFGISKLLEEGGGATQTGVVSGTPAYMPPEQWQGLTHTDARSDVYALGLIAYQALSARLPFEANTAPAWMQKHIMEPPMDLMQAVKHPVSANVHAAIMKALQKEPKDRFASMMEFKQALESRAAPAPAMLGAPPQLTPTAAPSPALAAAPAVTFAPAGGPKPPAPVPGALPQSTPQTTPLYANNGQVVLQINTYPQNAPTSPLGAPPKFMPHLTVAPERDSSWRLRNSLWILWTLTVVLNWVAFLVIGSRTQTKKWLIWGGVYAIPLLLAILSEPSSSHSYNEDTFSYQEGASSYSLATIMWIASIIHALVARGEYLRLLAAQEDAQRQTVGLR
jgi:eukaryotic-like serine/threonine-protein kinase